MHLFCVQSGKTVKKEVASFKREAALSISENSPDTEPGNKNTLLTECMFEACLGIFSSSHTNSISDVFNTRINFLWSGALLTSIYHWQG